MSLCCCHMGCTGPQGLDGHTGEYIQIQLPKAQLGAWMDKPGRASSISHWWGPNPALRPKPNSSSCWASSQHILTERFSWPIPEREKNLGQGHTGSCRIPGSHTWEYLFSHLHDTSGLHKFLPMDSQGIRGLHPVSDKRFLSVSHATSSLRHTLFRLPNA